MIVNANQLLFLFFCNFENYGMKPCKTHGVVAIDVTKTMAHQFFISYKMNDTNLSCICDLSVDVEKKIMNVGFSPKNKFDIFNLILPGNQDPQVIQKTYNLLHVELSKDAFNIKYDLTFDQLAELHLRYVDGNQTIPDGVA